MELRAETIIHAPANAVWAALGTRFGRIDEWAAPIAASKMDGEAHVGAVRTCQFTGIGPFKPGIVQEQLTEFDAETMNLAYVAVDGLPTFAEGAVNRFSVHALSDDRCLVRSQATMQLRGPMRMFSWLVRHRLERVGSQVLDELRYFVERGRPSPRKLQSAARAAQTTYSGASPDVATRSSTR
jgi:hypothetical protein